MAKRKYDFYHVATPNKLENFGDYHDALKYFGKAERPSTIYGVVEGDGDCFDDYVAIKSKYVKLG